MVCPPRQSVLDGGSEDLTWKKRKCRGTSVLRGPGRLGRMEKSMERTDKKKDLTKCSTGSSKLSRGEVDRLDVKGEEG